MLTDVSVLGIALVQFMSVPPVLGISASGGAFNTELCSEEICYFTSCTFPSVFKAMRDTKDLSSDALFEDTMLFNDDLFGTLLGGVQGVSFNTEGPVSTSLPVLVLMPVLVKIFFLDADFCIYTFRVPSLLYGTLNSKGSTGTGFLHCESAAIFRPFQAAKPYYS